MQRGNNNFGVFNETPTLDQFRYQLSYRFNDQDEIGVWGAVHGQSSTRPRHAVAG